MRYSALPNVAISTSICGNLGDFQLLVNATPNFAKKNIHFWRNCLGLQKKQNIKQTQKHNYLLNQSGYLPNKEKHRLCFLNVFCVCVDQDKFGKNEYFFWE